MPQGITALLDLLDKDFRILDLPQFKSSFNKIDNIPYPKFKNITEYIREEIINFLNLEVLGEQKKIVILLKTGIEAYASMVACLDLKLCYIPLNVENSIDYNSDLITFGSMSFLRNSLVLILFLVLCKL